MLNFYTDSAMANQITTAYPKRICLPLSGGSKAVKVYLGDPYSSTLSSAATSGDTTVHLTDTSEFLASGTARIATTDFTYTGKTSATLTGCSGVPTAANGAKVTPRKKYITSGNVTISPAGVGFNTQFNIQLSTNYPSVAFGFPQNSIIYTATQLDLSNEPLAVSVQANVIAGVAQEFINWGVISSSFAVRDIADSTAIGPTEGLITPYMYGYLNREDQCPILNQRIFQASRKISNLNPGFVVGKYRWKDENTINSFAFVPSSWTIDPTAIGIGSYVSGIGYGDDLKMVDLTTIGTSVYPILNRGEYFYLPFRNYLPADPRIDIILANSNSSYSFPIMPAPVVPVTVGTWTLNNNNAYIPQYIYTYVGNILNPDNSARTDLPTRYWYKTAPGVLQLSSTLPRQTIYIGPMGTTSTTTFQMPVYPLPSIVSAYAYYGGVSPNVPANWWTYNQTNRTLTINFPSGVNSGDAIFITYNPYVAIIYDLAPESYADSPAPTRTETSVDLNPANAGISSGFYYLEHRTRETGFLTLIANKTQIPVPTSYSAVPGIIAYGPVYTTGDYVLLTGADFTANGAEIVPGAVLTIVVGDGFTGLINYLDPNSETITVTTGGDGKVNFIYTPSTTQVGYFIPTTAPSGGQIAGLITTTVSNDTLVLPAPIPLSQLWNAEDGWIVLTYNVFNDQPFYGEIGADPTLGQIPYATTGSIGTTNWTSNGMISPITNSPGVYTVPIEGYDSSGRLHTDPSCGDIVKLQYLSSMDTNSDVGAYFVSFLQRVTIQLYDPITNIYSNPVLLQMQYPTPILEAQWLELNSQTLGIIDQFRLGWAGH